MTTAKTNLEDLMARARRGELTTEEERRLAIATETSLEARLLYDAGRGFDRESPVRPGDEALVERLADRVESADKVRASRAGRVTVLGAAAAVFIASAAAATGWVATKRTDPRQARPAAQSNSPAQQPQHKPRARAPIAPPEAEVVQEVEESDTSPAETAPDVRSRRGRPLRPSAGVAEQRHGSPAPLGDKPGEIFARANAARREGRTAEALSLYAELQARHPRSVEARHADLTVAELELRRGAAPRALALFRRYGAGPLAAEAAWGEVRALRQLGRTAEERSALRRLLQSYPDSPYAEAARKRLDDGGG